jgi:hypothetical protein
MACAPKEFIPRSDALDLKWDRTPSYNNQEDIQRIKDIGQVAFSPKYVLENNTETTPSEATHIILTRKEWYGIGVIVEKAKAYKELAEQEESLINTHIDIINSQKEYIELERRKSIEYRDLYMISENSFRQEEYRHKQDNLINKIGHYIIVIGGIALGISSL